MGVCGMKQRQNNILFPNNPFIQIFQQLLDVPCSNKTLQLYDDDSEILMFPSCTLIGM